MKEMLSYKDVVMLPNYSDTYSRDDLCTKVNFLGHKFNNPVLPANMECTISFDTAKFLAKNHYFYILHRFYPYKDILDWLIGNSKSKFIKSISIGVKQVDRIFLSTLASENIPCDFVTVDVAHGHNINVKEMAEYFHNLKWERKPKLILGNFGSVEGCKDAVSWGADCVKIGLSMGYACTTYNTTGVGTPMYSVVSEVDVAINNDVFPEVPIIADGQIREIGDACKALHAGAKMIMVGSMFASCKDSPAPYDSSGKKLYYGSASASNSKHSEYIEGKSTLIDVAEHTMLDLLNKFEKGIKSSMSYAGAKTPYELNKMQIRKRF